MNPKSTSEFIFFVRSLLSLVNFSLENASLEVAKQVVAAALRHIGRATQGGTDRFTIAFAEMASHEWLMQDFLSHGPRANAVTIALTQLISSAPLTSLSSPWHAHANTSLKQILSALESMTGSSSGKAKRKSQSHEMRVTTEDIECWAAVIPSLLPLIPLQQLNHIIRRAIEHLESGENPAAWIPMLGSLSGTFFCTCVLEAHSFRTAFFDSPGAHRAYFSL
jgi:hypothetical protein